MTNETPGSPDQSTDEVLFTAKINGVEKPVTAEQARRYAEQVGGIDAKLNELKSYESELRAWSDFKKGFQEDPHGALAELASAAGGTYMVPGASASYDDSGSEPDAVMQLKSEIENLKGQLYGFQAQTGLDKEISQLRGKYPDMTDDHLRQVLSTAGQYNGLPLEAAYRLSRFEEYEQKLKGAGEQPVPDTPEQPPISRGGNTPASLLAERANVSDFKKPIKDLMAAAWGESQKKLNVKFN